MYPTWGNKSTFDYDGSIKKGTTIRYGTDLANSHVVTAAQWRALLAAFRNQGIVPLGTSRNAPPSGSIGEWWHDHYNKLALMPYIGRILLREGYAEKKPKGRILINC